MLTGVITEWPLAINSASLWFIWQHSQWIAIWSHRSLDAGLLHFEEIPNHCTIGRAGHRVLKMEILCWLHASLAELSRAEQSSVHFLSLIPEEFKLMLFPSPSFWSVEENFDKNLCLHCGVWQKTQEKKACSYSPRKACKKQTLHHSDQKTHNRKHFLQDRNITWHCIPGHPYLLCDLGNTYKVSVFPEV